MQCSFFEGTSFVTGVIALGGTGGILETDEGIAGTLIMWMACIVCAVIGKKRKRK